TEGLTSPAALPRRTAWEGHPTSVLSLFPEDHIMFQTSMPNLPEDRERILGEANAAHANGNGKAKKNGRDKKGRFAAGNPGGPGNPHARSTAQLHKTFRDIAETEFVEVVKEIFRRAKAGEWHAQRMVLEYTLGKPAEATNPDRVDADEFERHCEAT